MHDERRPMRQGNADAGGVSKATPLQANDEQCDGLRDCSIASHEHMDYVQSSQAGRKWISENN